MSPHRLLQTGSGAAAFALMLVLALTACPGRRDAGVVHALVDGQDFYGVKKEFDISKNPSGDPVFTIETRRRASDPPNGPITEAELQIFITTGVPAGILGTYTSSNGFAVIDVNSESWSSANGGSLVVEVTQLDLGAQTASGTFRFHAKTSASDPRVLAVTDGSFLLLKVDDNR